MKAGVVGNWKQETERTGCLLGGATVRDDGDIVSIITPLCFQDQDEVSIHPSTGLSCGACPIMDGRTTGVISSYTPVPT